MRLPIGNRRYSRLEICATSIKLPSLFFLLQVILIFFRDLPFLLIASMHENPVLERYTFAVGDGEVPGGFIGEALEIMPAERVCSEKTIVPHVPPCRMPWILRVIE